MLMFLTHFLQVSLKLVYLAIGAGIASFFRESSFSNDLCAELDA